MIIIYYWYTADAGTGGSNYNESTSSILIITIVWIGAVFIAGWILCLVRVQWRWKAGATKAINKDLEERGISLEEVVVVTDSSEALIDANTDDTQEVNDIV